MKHIPLKFIALAGAAALSVAGLAACSPGSSNGKESAGSTTVTFRLWDENAAASYKKSFDEFTKANPSIKVDVQTVAWADYWDKLPTDIASSTGADIYWVNSSGYGNLADSGNLIDIGKNVGQGTDVWVPMVIDLYTRGGKLWGVPQLWDSIALFYNTDMLKAADVDPQQLSWSPEGNDTFLPAAKKLTIDNNGKRADESGFDAKNIKQYGFNASLDMQAIWLDFVASNGGSLQNGDEYAIDTPESVAAIQYVVDLINKDHVAPSAADTNDNGDLCLEYFAAGKMAMFQSGSYNLRNVSDNATDTTWAIAPMLTGPEGRVGVVNGIAAVGNAKSKNLDATIKVLKWIGTAEGQSALASDGAAFPAVMADQDKFVKYWSDKGVDIAPFLASSQGTTAAPPVGPQANAGFAALQPDLKEAFLGRMPVPEAVKSAQQKANEAIASN